MMAFLSKPDFSAKASAVSVRRERRSEDRIESDAFDRRGRSGYIFPAFIGEVIDILGIAIQNFFGVAFGFAWRIT